MFKEEEVRDDLHRLTELLKAINLKYGDAFSLVLAIGITIEEDGDEKWAGQAAVIGEEPGVHECMHALLANPPRFIVDFVSAIKCVNKHSDETPMRKLVVEHAADVIELAMLRENREVKERMAENAAQELVDDLLDKLGMKGN